MAITKSGIIDSSSTEYQFISLRNPVNLRGQTLQDITRPGVDGNAFRKMGKRGEPFEMLGVRDFETFDDSDSFQTALNDLIGTLVTLKDDYATEYHVIVLKVLREKNLPTLSHVGGVSGAAPGDAVALGSFRITLLHMPA